jgi:putative tryptophan/tyrosine transport system substrate-binding protein
MEGRMPVIIGRRELIAALGGAAVWPLSAPAQEGGRKYTIGIFSAGSEHAEIPALTAAFFEALRELFEGKNVAFEHRYAENRLERLPELAADLVRRKVDVIAAAGTLAPLAAKRATTTGRSATAMGHDRPAAFPPPFICVQNDCS